ncbi:hypothetical protein HDV03_004605 [Kappamyces sp. JEL0829]|nr:hypothetical protein HDV03_004605 [Kappamyces sp. JEL0829]
MRSITIASPTTLELIDPAPPTALAEIQPAAFIDIKHQEEQMVAEPETIPCHLELEEAPAYLKQTVLPSVLVAIHELLVLVKAGEEVPDPLQFLAKKMKPMLGKEAAVDYVLSEQDKLLANCCTSIAAPLEEPSLESKPKELFQGNIY